MTFVQYMHVKEPADLLMFAFALHAAMHLNVGLRLLDMLPSPSLLGKVK